MQRRAAATARNADPPATRLVGSAGNSVSTTDRKKIDPPEGLRRKQSKPNLFRINNFSYQHRWITNKAAQITNDFLHARTGVKGCFLAGVIRCGYASLYLYSIILLAIQMPTLFDPRKGLMPYSITQLEDVNDYDYSVFGLAPQSSLLMYAMFLLGIAGGFSLLLGIEPRKGAVGVFFVLHNLQSHNFKIYDHEFRMNKMWAFFLILLPLDHFTIFDDFGGLVPVVRRYLNLPPSRSNNRRPRRPQSTSWPMWPFRLWQVYTCMIYMGAGLGKLNTEPWIQGNALSWLWYDETIGRFYPAFVIELLYNRLISIKLQTWLSLLVENLSFVTIWPLKTRKITFVAIVLLHIGIELALVMHIFEYLSVLGWVCFFVYPNDGIPNSEGGGLTMNQKNSNSGGVRWSTATAFGSNRRKTFEIVVAVSLLYLLIYDIFPRKEVEELMPAPLAYLVGTFVYPPAFVDTKLDAFAHLIGINANPYILFAGIPAHMQTRMTAVIRFSDGKQPILHRDADWATSSFLEREIDYWHDTYLYYLMERIDDPTNIPYYAALSVNLAERYGKAGIDRQYNDITIQPSNTVESVSIQLHMRQGSELPAPPGWSLFASIPREWEYQSECQFVFTPQIVQLDDQPFVLPMNQLWDSSPGYADRFVKSGCVNYNPGDEALHREGQYGEPSAGDDDGDNGDAGRNYRPPNNQGDDDGENRNNGDDRSGGSPLEKPFEDANEEDDGKDGTSLVRGRIRGSGDLNGDEEDREDNDDAENNRRSNSNSGDGGRRIRGGPNGDVDREDNDDAENNRRYDGDYGERIHGGANNGDNDAGGEEVGEGGGPAANSRDSDEDADEDADDGRAGLRRSSGSSDNQSRRRLRLRS